MKRLSFCTLSPNWHKCGTVKVPKADTPTEAVESIMCTEESLRERVVNSLGGVECPSFNLFSTKEQGESRLVGLSQRVSSAVDFDTVTSNVLESWRRLWMRSINATSRWRVLTRILSFPACQKSCCMQDGCRRTALSSFQNYDPDGGRDQSCRDRSRRRSSSTIRISDDGCR